MVKLKLESMYFPKHNRQDVAQGQYLRGVNLIGIHSFLSPTLIQL